MTDPAPKPTAQDRHNAAIRAAIAQRQNAQYREVARLAFDTLDSGWSSALGLDRSGAGRGRARPPAVMFPKVALEKAIRKTARPCFD